MLSAEELLVLVIRDVGLRVMLIGQLSLDGELIVSFDGVVGDAAFNRVARAPAILVTDDEAFAASFANLAAGNRWRGLIHLTDDHRDRVYGANVAQLELAQAATRIRATLATWRAGMRPATDLISWE